MNFDDQYIVARVSGKAPDFTANTYQNGEFSSLSLYQDVLDKGKWAVVFFWPLDFTFVCPTEIQQFAEAKEKFEALGAQVIGVSVDSEHAHKAWSEGTLGQMNFPMVSDIQKEISIAYDVLHDDGVSLRGTFIIDPAGIIQSSTVNNLPIGRNVQETLRTLEAAQTGELCQAGWTKGEETLGKA